MISDWDENTQFGVRAAGSGWGRSSLLLKDNSPYPSQTRAMARIPTVLLGTRSG